MGNNGLSSPQVLGRSVGGDCNCSIECYSGNDKPSTQIGRHITVPGHLPTWYIGYGSTF
jgi:hypothetical protein